MQQTILITGANRGIGLGLVKGYLAINYAVIASCRDPKNAAELIALQGAANGKLMIEKLNVNNAEEFKQLAFKYSSQAIDILINNAGIFPEDHSPLGIEFADSQQVLAAFQTNALGALLAIQSFQANLLRAEKPKVVNLSSQMGALCAANGFGYSYRMSKVALNMLTKCFAAENNQIITVALRPGWVQTTMGGPNSTLSVEESVEKIIQVIKTLEKADSGLFLDNAKIPCEW